MSISLDEYLAPDPRYHTPMPLPPSIQLIPDPAGMRLILPPRERTTPAIIGIVPILFGMFFSGFALFWMASAAGFLDGRHPAPAVTPGPEAPPAAPRSAPVDWFRYAFALFGVPFFVVGLIPIGIGVASFFSSHAEVLITDDMLVAVEAVGAVRIRRRRPLAQIARLRIGQTFEKAESQNLKQRTNHSIYAESRQEPGGVLPPPLKLANRYPLDMLTPLAEYLIDQITTPGSTAVLRSGAAQGVALSIDPKPAPNDQPATDITAPAQPVNSKINFVPEADTLTFVIPHQGFRGMALSLMSFAIIWDAITLLISGVMLYQAIEDHALFSLGILFMIPFLATGVGITLGAIQLAYRKAVILATRQSLVFTQTGPIRKVEYQWAAPELSAFRCANSGSEINNRPLKQLQIASTGKTDRGILTGRDDTELEWLAGTLRGFYRLGS